MKLTSAKMTLDFLPIVAISYYSRPSNTLCYAERNGTRPWSHHELDTDGGSFTSLVLDSFCFPHISYHVGAELAIEEGDGTGSELRYCRFNGSTWVKETVDRWNNYIVSANVGVEGALALDESDAPRIAYRAYNYNHGQLNAVMFAIKDGIIWDRTTIAGGTLGSFGDFNQGAGAIPIREFGCDRVIYSADADGRALVSWFRGPEGDSARVIARAEVDGLSQGFCHWPSAIIANGIPHVAFGDVLSFGAPPTLDNLRHARRTQSGAWVATTIDGAHKVGQFTSIACDPHTGSLAISYLDRTTQTVRVARQSGQVWVIDDVDQVDTEFCQTSISIDRDSGIHVSYYSAATPGLMHAWRKASGAWVIETVVGGEGVGLYSSIEAV